MKNKWHSGIVISLTKLHSGISNYKVMYFQKLNVVKTGYCPLPNDAAAAREFCLFHDGRRDYKRVSLFTTGLTQNCIKCLFQPFSV